MTLGKSTSTVVFTHNSDATFRVWGSGVNAGLAAAGLVNTSDTGQINWTTVTLPGANTSAGYEIWRFDDTLQSTYPFFLKLWYGTAGSISTPRLFADFGTGSDGAGALTGNVRVDVWNNAGATAGTLGSGSLWVTHGEGYLALVAPTASGALTSGWRAVVERFRDVDGDPTSRGAYFLSNTSAANTSRFQYYLNSGASFVGPITQQPTPWNSVGVAKSVQYGGKTIASGLTPIIPGSPHGDGILEKTLGVMTVSDADYLPGDTFDIVRWDGATHRYLVTNNKTGEGASNLTGVYSCILWD